MNCPKCGKENVNENAYCIFCGEIMKKQETKPVEKTEPKKENKPTPQPEPKQEKTEKIILSDKAVIKNDKIIDNGKEIPISEAAGKLATLIIEEKGGAVELKDPEVFLEKKMKHFRKYNLSEDSNKTLERIFTFQVQKYSVNKIIPQNMMVHCDDIDIGKLFVNEFQNQINECCNKDTGIGYVEETEFLSDYDKCKKLIEEKTTLCIFNCMTEKDYEEKRNSKVNPDNSWKQFKDLCKQTPNVLKIIISPNSVLKERFENDTDLYCRQFIHHIYINDLSPDRIYELTMEKFRRDKIKYVKSFETKLKKYIENVYPSSDLKNLNFIDDLVNQILMIQFGKFRKETLLTEKDVPHFCREKTPEEVLENLNKKVGLKNIKKAITDIAYIKQHPLGTSEPSCHLALKGPSGSGKTMVGEELGELFYSLGVTRTNKIVKVCGTDLIAKYVGHTGPQTKSYCEKAYGGVLFIDEAGSLAPSDNKSNNDTFREEALKTLAKEMEDNRDKLVVVFAGHPEEIDDLLSGNNSELGSRISKVVEFEGYSDDELLQIFVSFCGEEGFRITDEAMEKIRLKIRSVRYSDNFGNARTVRNIFNEAKIEYFQDKEKKELVLEERHIKIETKLIDFDSAKKELDEMIGLDSIRKEIKKMAYARRFSKENNMEITSSNHMILTGNAGTGKTTVANLYSQMLYSIDATKSPNFVSIAAGDLMTTNNVAEKLKMYCRKAEGGVLLIDEAYVLKDNPHVYSSCISILLDILESKRDKIIIILAGYENEMNVFLNANPGLKSRFSTVLHFDDYSLDQLTEIFQQLCSNNKFTVTEKGMEQLQNIITKEKAKKNFGNARTIRTIFEQAVANHSYNYYEYPEKTSQYILDENDIKALAI